MDRLTFDSNRIEELRTELRGFYPDYEKPCPASALKNYDDVMWIDIIPIRVLWGHDDPDFFNGYSPDIFGDCACNVDGHLITDRAPVDPTETPMPIWPTQQYAQQPGVREHVKQKQQKALHHLLSQLDHEHQQKVRELVRQKRPELLDEHEPHK